MCSCFNSPEPFDTPPRGPFSQRSSIIFPTFSAVLVTLVVQGLSLPPLIRALGLAGRSTLDCDEQEAQRLMSEAGLAFLSGNRAKDEPAFAGIYDDMRAIIASTWRA